MRKDRPSFERGDAVAQSGLTRYLRFIRVKHLEATSGDDLADAVRAWFTADSETYTVPDSSIENTAELSEDRELIDWEYRVENGIHHVMIFYAE